MNLSDGYMESRPLAAEVDDDGARIAVDGDFVRARGMLYPGSMTGDVYFSRQTCPTVMGTHLIFML